MKPLLQKFSFWGTIVPYTKDERGVSVANYYIDYENVHNEGLKGVYQLQQGDKLTLFYSSKADTLKIDVVRQLMECPAEIQFEKIVNGVENALDFQLITALMCNYLPEERYYIISRDKGYDAAIEMAGKQNRTNVYRCRDIDGAIKHAEGLGIDENDHDIIVDLQMDTEEPEAVAEVIEAVPVADITHEEPELGLAANDPVLELVPEKPEEAKPAVEQKKEDKQAPEEKADEIAESPAQEQHQESQQPRKKGRRSGSKAARSIVEEETVEQQEPEVIAEAQEDSQAKAEPVESESKAAQEEIQAQAAPSEEPDRQELERRAYQSMCTKIMNNIKMVHKIPLNYKQAGEIYEALMDSDSKMQFYHRLLQSMGRKKGGELYQKVKAIYKPVRALYQAAIEEDSSQAVEEDKAVQAVENVENVKAAFEQAEQLQGNPGEAILKMVDLVKKK